MNAFRQVTSVRMTLHADGWWRSVPAQGGWYCIETNAPLSVLASLPPPPSGTNQYNIPERIRVNKWVLDNGLAIAPPASDARYVVYTGEQSNLMARAREHTHGNEKTGCLKLSGYPELHGYDWCFSYVTCESVFPGCGDDKTLRVAGEQAWRAAFGWPLLCKE
jgi:hypothetical protein